MTEPHRPMGLCILSIFWAIIGLLGIIFGIIRFPRPFSGEHFLYGIIWCIIAWGLWELKDWGRRGFFIFVAWMVFFQLLIFPFQLLINVPFYIISIWYLIKPEIKKLFTVGKISQ